LFERLRQYGGWLPVLLAGFYLLNLCHRTPLGEVLGVACHHCSATGCGTGAPRAGTAAELPVQAGGSSEVRAARFSERAAKSRCCLAHHKPAEGQPAEGQPTGGDVAAQAVTSVDTISGVAGLPSDFTPPSDWPRCQAEHAECAICAAWAKVGQAWWVTARTPSTNDFPAKLRAVAVTVLQTESRWYAVRGPPQA